MLTRFYDRQSGLDGPVSGALQIVYVPMPSITGAQTPEFNIAVPQGMGFTITNAYFTAAATGATPTIAIGNEDSTTNIVDTTTLTTDLGALTLSATYVTVNGGTNGDVISVLISSTGSDTITEGNLTIVGHVSHPPYVVGSRPGYPNTY